MNDQKNCDPTQLPPDYPNLTDAELTAILEEDGGHPTTVQLVALVRDLRRRIGNYADANTRYHDEALAVRADYDRLFAYVERDSNHSGAVHIAKAQKEAADLRAEVDRLKRQWRATEQARQNLMGSAEQAAEAERLLELAREDARKQYATLREEAVRLFKACERHWPYAYCAPDEFKSDFPLTASASAAAPDTLGVRP